MSNFTLIFKALIAIFTTIMLTPFYFSTPIANANYFHAPLLPCTFGITPPAQVGFWKSGLRYPKSSKISRKSSRKTCKNQSRNHPDFENVKFYTAENMRVEGGAREPPEPGEPIEHLEYIYNIINYIKLIITGKVL